LPAPCAVLKSGAPACEASGQTIVTCRVYQVFLCRRQDVCDDSSAWIRQCQRFPLVSTAESDPISLELTRRMRANSRGTMFLCATAPCGAHKHAHLNLYGFLSFEAIGPRGSARDQRAKKISQETRCGGDVGISAAPSNPPDWFRPIAKQRSRSSPGHDPCPCAIRK
jgi:hypothetical protein